MENASKALIIAGAILLSILIISLGIMVYSNAKNTYGSTINEDSSFVPYDGVKNEISANLNIKASNAKASNYPSLFEKVNIAYYTKTDFTENVEIFSLNKGITKIRVYMWIEGQDVDCENDASVGNISLNLQFSKNPN